MGRDAPCGEAAIAAGATEKCTPPERGPAGRKSSSSGLAEKWTRTCASAEVGRNAPANRGARTTYAPKLLGPWAGPRTAAETTCFSAIRGAPPFQLPRAVAKRNLTVLLSDPPRRRVKLSDRESSLYETPTTHFISSEEGGVSSPLGVENPM